MFKTDNSLHVFVTSSVAEDTSIAAAGSGDIFVVDENNAIVSDADIASDHTYIKIGQKDAAGNVRFTPLFKYANITKKTSQQHDVDRTEQYAFLGSNGSTGSIDAVNSNRYTLRVNFKNNVEMFSQQSDQHFFEYVSDASATQGEIADYFAQTMSKSEKFSGKRTGKKRASVKVERFSDAADSAIAATITTMAIVNGSNYITAVLASADLATIVVGDYLRIGEDGHVTDVPVATTDAVYKVVSKPDATTIELDQPYQGTTALLQQSEAVEIITAAAYAASNVGIRVMGLEQDYKLGLIPDAGNQVTFDVTVDGWADTTALANTPAVLGDGTARAIADLEWFAQGAAGAPYRNGTPNNADLITLFADGTLATSYNTLELQVDLDDPGHAVAGSGKGKMCIVLASLEGTGNSNITTAFGGVTPAWD